jgi:hypothetical protein
VQQCITAALTSRSLKKVPPEVLESALIELQEERKEIARSRRFKDGIKCQRAITQVIACHLAQAKIAVQRATLDRHKVQARGVEQEVRAYDEETKQLILNRMTAQAEKRNQLLEDKKLERGQLNTEWDSIRRARMYNRPSARVTVLRQQQTLLAVQCRFEEADVVAKIIDEVVRNDENEHARARQIDYEEALAKLKAKQAAEIAFFDEHCVIEIALLRQQRAILRRALENKEKKIEARVEAANDVDRVWNARQSERLEMLATGRFFGTPAPSSRIKREEVAKTEGGFLLLPPLKLEVEKSARRGRRKKGRESG